MWRAPVNLNRMTNRPQLQFVTDLYSASFYQRLGQRNLKFARHLCHGVIIALVKDSVKDSALIRGDGHRGRGTRRSASLCAGWRRALCNTISNTREGSWRRGR